MEFKIKSPLGCQGGSAGSAARLLKWMIVFFVAYMVIGYVVKMRTKNLSGKEAIPNIEFWRSLPGLTQEGAIVLMNRVKIVIQIIKNKISKKGDSGYSQV